MPQQSDKEILIQFFNQLKADVVANQKAKGIYASGASAEGLTAEANDIEVGTTGQLIDTAGYFQYQEFGRGPSKNAGGSGQTLQERIYQWIADKGLPYSDDKQRKSISYAIATKIHREGTLTFRLGKQTGVLSEVLTSDKIESITSVFAKKYASQVSSDVFNSFK